MRKHPTAFAMEKFLHGEGSRAGEPDASRDTHGSSRHRACSKACSTASLHAEVRLGRLSQRLGPLIGHPLRLLNRWRESRTGYVCGSSPAPDANWHAEYAEPRRCIGRYEGTTLFLGRRASPQWRSAIVTQVTTEPQDVCGAATLGGHLHTEITSAQATDCRLRQDQESGEKKKIRS
jgi:hypothetical protein